MKTMNTVSCRCGGGKTVWAKEMLYNKHISYFGTTLVASKTKDLSTETSDTYKGRNVILDDRVSNNVQADLIDMIDEGYHGVIFITHATLFNLPEYYLSKVDVIVDEIPLDVVEYVQLEVKNSTITGVLNTWLDKHVCEHTNYHTVSVREEYVGEVKAELKAAQSNRSALNEDAIKVLQFLVEGYDVMYTTIIKQEDVFHLYQAIKTTNLRKLSQAKNVTLLAANIENTLTGAIAKHRFGIQFQDITPSTLEKKHKQKIILKPFLKEGRYSSSFKNSIASDVIANCTSDSKAIDVFNDFVENDLGDNFLIFKNNDDRVPSYVKTKDNVKVLGTQVHGLNSYTQYTKGAFTASIIPTPMMIKAIRMYAKDHGMDSDELVALTITEKSLEAAYQCAARMAFRNADNTEVCTFIVPDMSYVEYFESWFEDGNVIVDTTDSYVSVEVEEKEKAKKIRLQTVVAVLLAKKNKAKGVTMPEILKNHGIHRNTFASYKNEFSTELKELKLIK